MLISPQVHPQAPRRGRLGIHPGPPFRKRRVLAALGFNHKLSVLLTLHRWLPDATLLSWDVGLRKRLKCEFHG